MITKDHPQHVYVDNVCKFDGTPRGKGEPGNPPDDDLVMCLACRMGVGHYILCEFGRKCACGCANSLDHPANS